MQEVFWRSYFKGWLKPRPSILITYQKGLTDALNRLKKERATATNYLDAVSGRSGIDGFDGWALELVEKGYLQNRARIWFASVWILTLRLP